MSRVKLPSDVTEDDGGVCTGDDGRLQLWLMSASGYGSGSVDLVRLLSFLAHCPELRTLLLDALAEP